jgi:hypothetical protein
VEYQQAPQVCICAHFTTHFFRPKCAYSYVGEVGVWTGIWALSTAALQTAYFPQGTVALAAISPFFTWFLLRHVCQTLRFHFVLTQMLTHR